MATVNHVKNVRAYLLKDDGTFPNNGNLPLLYYPSYLPLSDDEPAAEVEKVFQQNYWGGSWRNDIYNFHHYHSQSREVLGIYSGKANVQLGGPEGIKLGIKKGDVIVIPAGRAHKNLVSSDDFHCVGAYPKGQENYDMNYSKAGERPKADKNISKVSLPEADPVLEKSGR